MQAILNNPYRTVGLLVGATAREKDRQIKRLKQFIEAEEEPQDDFSFPSLGSFNRTVESVEEASSKLNLESDKINAALFWFWNGNPITDEAAFDALKDGDIEAAHQIWDKLIVETKEDGKRFWKPLSEKNYSAYHNSSILNLIRANGNLHTALVASLYFLENDLVHKFVSSVADETHKTNKKDLQTNFLTQVHSEIERSKKFSSTKFLEIINKQEFLAKQDFIRRFLQKPIEQIEQAIETAKGKRKANKANGAKAGEELYTYSTNPLAQLKNIVGANDIKYSSVADKLANEILQCSIDYFNESQEKESNAGFAEIAMALAKKADAIAVGTLAKERVKDSIDTLEEMKDKEILQATHMLQSVKDAYEKNKAEINMRVMTMPLGYNQTVNWSKVNKMIENSLDWEKVIQLIQEVIPPKNVEKIKNVKNQAKLNEYKSLVNFVMSKLTYLQKNKVRYISYWETPTSVPMPTSGDIEKIPSWVWWVVGIIVIIILSQTCN